MSAPEGLVRAMSEAQVKAVADPRGRVLTVAVLDAQVAAEWYAPDVAIVRRVAGRLCEAWRPDQTQCGECLPCRARERMKEHDGG